MAKCIYTGREFERADGEHILQNFLGARWTDNFIVCNEVQSQFGGTIDSALERGLRQVRMLVGNLGGRGGEGASVTNLVSSEGEVVDLLPGGKPRLRRPIVDVKPHPSGEGHIVHIEIGNESQAAWAAAELKKLLPNSPVDAEHIIKHGIKTNLPLKGKLHLRLGLGGSDYIRGVLKAAMNMLGAKDAPVLAPAFDAVREFVLSGTGDPLTFLRWPRPNPSAPPAPAFGPVDHFLAVVSRGQNVDGLLQVYGHMRHALRLATNYEGPPIKLGYLVNPLRNTAPAEAREPEFDEAIIPNFDAEPALAGTEAFHQMTGAMSAILDYYMNTSREEVIENLVKDVFGTDEDVQISKEMLIELRERLLRHFFPQFFRDLQ